MSVHRYVAEQLVSIHAAGAVDASALAGALDRFTAHEHPDQAVLLQEGRPSDELLILLDGEVAVTAGDALIARIPGPAVLGHLGVLAGLGRSATVTATGPVEVLTLQRQPMWRLVDGESAEGTALRRLLLAAMAELLVHQNTAIASVPATESLSPPPTKLPASDRGPGPKPQPQPQPEAAEGWGFDEDLLRQAEDIELVEDEASKRRKSDG